MLLFCCLSNHFCVLLPFMYTSFLKVSSSAQSYSSALEQLTNSYLMAPVYYIIAGPAPDFGAVISRDRLGAADVQNLGKMPEDWYLLETNYVRKFQFSKTCPNVTFVGRSTCDCIEHTLSMDADANNVWEHD